MPSSFFGLNMSVSRGVLVLIVIAHLVAITVAAIPSPSTLLPIEQSFTPGQRGFAFVIAPLPPVRLEQ